MQFLKFFNYKLRHNHFIQGHWHKYTLLNARTSLLSDHELKMAWNRLLTQVNMCHEGVEANERSTDSQQLRSLKLYVKNSAKEDV